MVLLTAKIMAENCALCHSRGSGHYSCNHLHPPVEDLELGPELSGGLVVRPVAHLHLHRGGWDIAFESLMALPVDLLASMVLMLLSGH